MGVARAPEGTSAFWTDTVIRHRPDLGGQVRVVAKKAVLTGCDRRGSGATLTWTSAANPTSFQIRHQNPTTEPLLAGTLRTGSTADANFNGSAGEVWVVAITGGLESESNHFRYSGNGSGASCVAVK